MILFTVVTSLAQHLKISLAVLFVIKTHSMRRIVFVVSVALRDNANEGQPSN